MDHTAYYGDKGNNDRSGVDALREPLLIQPTYTSHDETRFPSSLTSRRRKMGINSNSRSLGPDTAQYQSNKPEPIYYHTDGHSAFDGEMENVTRVASYCSADSYDLRSVIQFLNTSKDHKYRLVSHWREFVHLQIDLPSDAASSSSRRKTSTLIGNEHGDALRPNKSASSIDDRGDRKNGKGNFNPSGQHHVPLRLMPPMNSPSAGGKRIGRHKVSANDSRRGWSHSSKRNLHAGFDNDNDNDSSGGDNCSNNNNINNNNNNNINRERRFRERRSIHVSTSSEEYSAGSRRGKRNTRCRNVNKGMPVAREASLSPPGSGPRTTSSASEASSRSSVIRAQRDLSNSSIEGPGPTPELDGPKEIPVSYQYRTADILVFRYGAFVCWDMTEVEEAAFLALMKRFEKEPYSNVESENFGAVVSGSRVRMINDVLHLTEGQDSLSHVLEKVSVSHAIAQDAKLSAFEEAIEELIEETMHIPKELAENGRITLSHKATGRRMGQLGLFIFRINLSSDILDMPDWLWDQPDQVERDYIKVHKYLDIEQRLDVLNRRLGILSDLFELMRTEQTNSHSTNLEWIVIILIVVEVLLGAASFFIPSKIPL